MKEQAVQELGETKLKADALEREKEALEVNVSVNSVNKVTFKMKCCSFVEIYIIVGR